MAQVENEAIEAVGEGEENPGPLCPELFHDEIENIVKFADSCDLKSLRLLNKVWNAAATRQFRQKSTIVLNLGQNSKQKLERFGEETEKLQPIKEIRILMNNRPTHPSFSEDDAPNEFALFNEILQNVSSTLEELGISRELSYQKRNPKFFPFRESIQFPALVKLNIQNYDLGFENGNIISICNSLFRNAPNIQQLNFVVFDKIFFSPLLNLDGSRNWNLLPKLVGLKVSLIDDPDKFQFLANFPQTFENLDLDCFNAEGTALEKLLEKNKKSLLHLRLNGLRGSSYSRSRQTLKFKFPSCFPKLESLELNFDDLDFEIDFGKRKRLAYWKRFPVLKDLSFYFEDFGDDIKGLENVWKTFFPKQVCTSLEFLEINFESLFFNYLMDIGEDEFWHSEIFPNARIKDNCRNFVSMI